MSEELTAAEYEEVLAEHNRLVAELDMKTFGQDRSARAPSLVDLVKIIPRAIAELRLTLARARYEAETLRAERDGSVWLWQGDGHDDVKSLACPVLIQPEALRPLVWDSERIQELEVRVAAIESRREAVAATVRRVLGERDCSVLSRAQVDRLVKRLGEEITPQEERLRAALAKYVDEFGGQHAVLCPMDDGCECAEVREVNELLAGYDGGAA